MGRTVIWDWNGTLLDDVEACIAAANVLLARRDLEPMTRARYYRLFTFPVIRYYEAMGFDFTRESFDDVAVEYHAAYGTLVGEANLHADARSSLARLSDLGIQQAVLSALEEERLRNELQTRQIHHYFTHVFGLADLHAWSKAARGLELLEATSCDREQCWMVGDTAHDAEVARAMGIRCVLVSCGHQSEARLKETGVAVVRDLRRAVEMIERAMPDDKKSGVSSGRA